MHDAAAVIVLRPGPQRGYQVLLVRRRRGASFMGSACVFPGGGAEVADGGELAMTAARELFEEAGLLLGAAGGTPLPPRETPWSEIASAHAIDRTALVPWSHWMTPSVEPRRFSARFFVTLAPPAQEAAPDHTETTASVWVTPAEGVVRAGELALPPPQLRTLWELMRMPTVDDVFNAARGRSLAPILPRLGTDPRGACLLLPWDPAYRDGHGDAQALPDPAPAWAVGKSRFVRRGDAWDHVTAPA